MITTHITYRGDAEIQAKKLAGIVSTAMGQVIEHRHKRLLRRHFEAGARQRYRYQARQDKYNRAKRRVKGHGNPLVWSGDLKRQTLRRISVQTYKSKAKAVGRMKGPRYLYMAAKGNHPPMGEELARDTRDEAMLLARLVDRLVTRALAELKDTRTVTVK